MKAPVAVVLALSVLLSSIAAAADPQHPVMQWVKQHPRAKPAKPSPRMGYETSYGYDPVSRLLIRYGGHNQGGGGEQNSEVWTYDLTADAWTLQQPDDAPPGVCCAAQNVFDEAAGVFVRFPAFSGSHGWQSFREIYLKDSSVWTYDLPTNTFRAMRPWPEVRTRPLRGAAWDPHHQVIVIHGGETGSYGTLVYDLYANRWHRMKPRITPPTTVSGPGFAYDAAHRLFVLFGSQFGTDTRTWLYDLPANQWRVLETDTHPPADKTAPVMAADTRNGIVLCVLYNEGKLETWALDVARRTWQRLRLPAEPDPSGARNRVLVYLEDRNLFVLENRTQDQQQIWTFRYADAPPPAPRPANLRLTTTAYATGGAQLGWDAPADGKGKYNVYRGAGEEPWKVDLKLVAKAVSGGSYTDGGLEPGRTYFYQVRPVDEAGEEGPGSFLARTSPAAAADPVVSVISARRVELSWPAAEAKDVIGWHVERAPVSVYSSAQVKQIAGRTKAASDLAVGKLRRIGTFERLTKSFLPQPHYVDESLDLSKPTDATAGEIVGSWQTPASDLVPEGKAYRYGVWAYRVRAVNRLGVVGGPSPYVLTIPSAVRNVFAKEADPASAELKWQANPEKGLRGYLLYRLAGRWNSNPVDLLTPEPLAGTGFTDPASGARTRRYFIVAVDALGQQGLPSRPVWSRREWARFYVPYAGPWHQ